MLLYHRTKQGQPVATMKRLLEDQMAIQGQDVWICPDEGEILLEALYAYSVSNDGRRKAGRVAWLREKVLQAVKNNSAIKIVGT